MFSGKHVVLVKRTEVVHLLCCLILNLNIVANYAQTNSTQTAVPSLRVTENVNLNTLRLVQVVFRHGYRSPITTYPTDPYKDYKKYWSVGPGQLTQAGMNQQYDLGSYFRQRYDGFLGSTYSPSEINVLSSDKDRAIMSAEANIAGLFPKQSQRSNANVTHGEASGSKPILDISKIGVQLVPIHTLPAEYDQMLKMSAKCPRKDEAKAEFFATSHEYANFEKENKELVKTMNRNLGISEGTNLRLTIPICEPLFCQNSHNMKLPDWASPTVLRKISELRGTLFAMASGTEELKRLTGGPLLEQVLNNMVSFQNRIPDPDPDSQLENGIFFKKNTKPKMYMYSAHDDTIATVLTAIGVFDPQIPPFGSTLIFELHQSPNEGDYFVQFFFRNSTVQNAYALTIPGCEFSCPLSTLVSILEPVIPLDWDEECKAKREGEAVDGIKTGTSGLSYFLGFLGIALVVLVILAAINFPRFRNCKRVINVNSRASSYVQF